MKKTIFLFILLSTISIRAQTVTKTLQWDLENITLTVVQTYTAALSIDSGSKISLTPTCITNVTTPANVVCSTPITLTPGNHTIVVTETSTDGESSSGTLNYSPIAATVPTRIKIIIKIVVP